MKRIARMVVPVLALLTASSCTWASSPDQPDEFFEARIRPLFHNRCGGCHGLEKREGGLRLDSREALLRGGRLGAVLVPGAPERSLLFRAVSQAGSLRMPPDKPLPAAEIEALSQWIRNGAKWPAKESNPPDRRSWWSFQTIRRPAIPDVKNWAWVRTPVDAFILARLERAGLKPRPQADRRTLIRRLCFDLTGLPPAPAEVEAFVADRTAGAYDRLVERLLASAAYGERWGRHWMDVARYADTAGDNADYPVPEARLYRDYIIDSFNADKPFDQFIREQIAGDLLARDGPPDRYAEQVIATGFLALSRRYATAPYELWHLTLEDTIDTVGKAFLGLTLKCARCHDHKFDPISTTDYYALYGIFNSTQFPWAGGEELASKSFPRSHFVPLLPPNEATPRLAAWTQTISSLKAEMERAKPKPPPELSHRLMGLERPGLPADLPGAYAVADGTPADAALQVRGDPEQPGPRVARDDLRLFAGDKLLAIPPGESGRRQLADWVASPANPLTARVIVNRIWQWHFGEGLVRTSSNFGTRGSLPSHPELLDWLAATMRDGFRVSGVGYRNGNDERTTRLPNYPITQLPDTRHPKPDARNPWSVKSLHRLIVLSSTYTMSSGLDNASLRVDPGNRLHWRFSRRRLDAEAIRDALLSVSGTIDLSRPGPHPFPSIDSWKWTQHEPFKEVYPMRHRSVYLMTQRLQRHPFLALFDGTDTNTTTEARSSSTVAAQALYWMNNPELTEIAEAFAKRLLAEASDPEGRIERAYALAYSRPPTRAETVRCRKHVEEARKEIERAGAPADRRELEAWRSLARVLLSSSEFLYVD